jgi:predicted anti-sigma-YlaC factor YlaD
MAMITGDCERVRAAVSLDVDGEASELERTFLDAHVASCDACAGYRDDVLTTTSLLRAQPLEPFAYRVTVSFNRRTWRGRGLRASTTAAAALVLVGLIGATQVARSPVSSSRLSVGVSRSAGSSAELRQIYREFELVGRPVTPRYVATARVQ